MPDLITKVYIAKRTRTTKPPQLHSAVNDFPDNPFPFLFVEVFENKNSILYYF